MPHYFNYTLHNMASYGKASPTMSHMSGLNRGSETLPINVSFASWPGSR